MASVYWGIDVSPTSLKAVKLEGSKASPTLTEVDAVNFGVDTTGAASEGNIRPEVQEGLIDFAQGHDFTDAVVSTSLPSHTTFNRFTTLPPVKEGRTEELVRHEAQQHIPFPLDDVIWDYQAIEKQGAEGGDEVIIFAIKKEIVNEFLTSLQMAGLDPDIIQFSSVALYNFIQFDRSLDRTTAVLDLGANNCDLMIIEGDRHWTRDIPVSADDFTGAIQQEFEVSFEKAEQIKRGMENSPEVEKYFDVLKPVYRNLIQEVHRSIGYYKSMSSGSTIEQICLTGGGARTYQLEEFISENMDLPVSRMSRLNNISFSDELDDNQFNQIGMSVGPATGLALQGMGATKNRMNLVPDRVVQEKELQRKKPFVISAVVLIGLAALLYIFSLQFRYNVYGGWLEQLNEQQQAVASTKQQIEEFQSTSSTERLNQIGQQIHTSLPDRQLPALFWDELMRLAPDNVALRNQLNAILLPYFKEAEQNSELPASYAALRRLDADQLSEKWQQVRADAEGVEKKFLYILGVDYSQDDNRTSFDVYCGIFRRSSTRAGYSFVENNVFAPLQETFHFENREDTQYIFKQGESNQLSSPFTEQEEGASSFDQQKHFWMYKVRFQGETQKLNAEISSGDQG
jgi:type IV pilus assembly protein PilM